MDKFWQLLRESVIVQASVTFIFSLTLCVLIVLEKPIPDIVVQVLMLIVGFYFGSKSTFNWRG